MNTIFEQLRYAEAQSRKGEINLLRDSHLKKGSICPSLQDRLDSIRLFFWSRRADQVAATGIVKTLILPILPSRFRVRVPAGGLIKLLIFFRL
jgi:hypothetical protein